MTFGQRAAELAGLASSVLGWRPDDFWSATPAELATALGLDAGGYELIDRSALAHLLNQFPDNRET